MDQRAPFIADYRREVFEVADLARRYGISRKTAYKWIDRYEAEGPPGLLDRGWVQSVAARVPEPALDGGQRRSTDVRASLPRVRPPRHDSHRQRRALRDDGPRPVVHVVALVDSSWYPPRAGRAGLSAAERAP
jgi:transposase-like protein